ncbi:MAG: hypothetical protein KC505_00910 [Myxococcales bacterium]|nr:hypothetical protein [Myxococcales bacterium]USN50345.1 MAG: hypothetical protein H6731_08775 [Myxococcales bacterium]
MKNALTNVLAISLFVFLGACTSTSENIATHLGYFKKANISQEKLLKAQQLHEMGLIESAILQLKELIEKPYEVQHDKGYELLIAWLLELRMDNEAKDYASYFMRHHSKSPSVEYIVSLFR